jgi:phenylpropionate dioxygenase-like ring-hydroxylating dioxygenase large terminal subunit
MKYLRNCWYVAALEDEIGDEPFGRTLLGEPVVFFRAEGKIVALEGKCPHRFAPLKLGKVVEDTIQCAYHGLQFNKEGRCVFNPQGKGSTPSSARLKSYPVTTRYGMYWIWMGDPELADPALLPHYPFLEDPLFAKIEGYMHTLANYELVTDNIMDLGHVDFLHANSLGCEATAKAKAIVRREGNAVSCDRFMPDDYQGPLFSWLWNCEGRKVDAWIDVKWEAPSLMQLDFAIAEVGQPREQAPAAHTVHIMTPETDTTTHYFWRSTRNFQIEDEGLSEALRSGIDAAFSNEDKPMLQAQQEIMGTTDLWSLNPVLLSGDAAPVLVRRVLADLIAKEAA